MVHPFFTLFVALITNVSGAGASPVSSVPAAPPCARVCEQELSEGGKRECLKREQERAQEELDAIVAAVRSDLSRRSTPEDRECLSAFESAQTAWSAYEVADCQAVAANWAGGSGQRVARVYCLLEHIRQRSFEVRRNYHLERLPEPLPLCCDASPDS